MVRQRTPAKSYPIPQLGDSWVVESDGDEGDNEYTPPPASKDSRQLEASRHVQKHSELTESPRKRPPRRSPRASAEPEFIMPSIHEGSIDGIRLEEEKRRYEARQPGTRRRSPEKRAAPRRSGDATAQDKLVEAMENIGTFVKPILRWSKEVLGGAMHILKTPFSYVIAIWLLFGLMVFLRNLLFSSVYSALSPICRIPGASFLDLPMCHSSIAVQYDGNDPPPVQFDQLMAVQSRFEEVLQESAGGVSLPLDMKRGETSIRDLRQVVRFSHLHSKNELVLEFDGFIEMARIASYDLQKFNSHVGRGVDNILATARWTKRVLDGIAEKDASQGAIASFFNDKVLAPFQPVTFTEDRLLETYIQHTRAVEDEISRLVTEAQALLMILQNLEDRLDVIHGIAIRDNVHAQGSKEEVLSQLWTMLGGNRSKLGKFDSQLRLLNQVNTYRQNAIAHVSGTLIKLQGMGTELEELRERVGGVELLGGRGAVPLRLHIENIEMGVERLERGRKGARELENEELSKSLGRSEGGRKSIDE